MNKLVPLSIILHEAEKILFAQLEGRHANGLVMPKIDLQQDCEFYLLRKTMEKPP